MASDLQLRLGGVKGTRTPDPLLANNRQHVHRHPYPQVTVPGRPSASLRIRSCCGTSVLYFAAVHQHPCPSRHSDRQPELDVVREADGTSRDATQGRLGDPRVTNFWCVRRTLTTSAPMTHGLRMPHTVRPASDASGDHRGIFRSAAATS
jgi:hypothetical protein